MLALVCTRGEEEGHKAERRRDEKHHDMLRRREIERDRAEMNRGPLRQLDLACEAWLEARELEVVRVRDVRGDDVLTSEHMISRRIRAASMRTVPALPTSTGSLVPSDHPSLSHVRGECIGSSCTESPR